MIGGMISIADFSVPAIFMNAHYAGYDVDKFHYPGIHNYLQFMWDHKLYQDRFAEEEPIIAGLKEKVAS